jgi:hypothetical protein
MFTITLDSPAPHIYGYSVLIAFGCGMSFNLGYTVAGVKMALKGGSAHDVNLVVTMQNISQLGGTLMSLLISGQVFQSYSFKNLKVVLSGEGLSDDQIRSCIAGTRSTILTSLSPDLARGATEAITKAISKLYVLLIIAGGLCLLGSLFMKHERLFK